MTASDVIAELALATKEQMAAVVAPLLERIAALEATVAAQPPLDIVAAKAALLVPKPLDGRHAEPIDVEAIAAKAALLVPRPSDGKDAPIVDVEAIAAKAALLVPKPLDGRDAPPVDVDAIAMKAATMIPQPRDGRDGKDATPVDVEAIAVKAASLVPTPADGKDAPMVDVDAIAAKAALLVPRPVDGKDAPVPDLDAIATKAAALIPVPRDGRDGERGQDGQPGAAGADGKDAPPVDLDAVAVKAAALVPPARDGRDGKDAPPLNVEDIALKAALLVPPVDDIETLVKASVEMAVKALPIPKDGVHGRDGRDGKDVDAVLLETIVAARVERVLSGWERPADGTSVTVADVAPLIEAEVTKAVKAIPAAKDGVGIQAAFITHDGELALTFSNGGQAKVGPVVGAPGKDADMALLQKQITDEIARIPKPKDGVDGKDGERGADGLGFDDMDGILDDEKGFVFRWARGERVKEQAVPVLLDRGVYKPGVLYRKGAAVTAQGSLWIAQADTRERPGDGSTSWRLAVKKGRDGKDAGRTP